jgi:hypothetical protein
MVVVNITVFWVRKSCDVVMGYLKMEAVYSSYQAHGVIN